MMMRWTAVLLALVLGCVNASAGEYASMDGAAEAVLRRHGDARVLVLGELHGTEQTAPMVLAVAKQMCATRPLIVGLEMPQQEQAALNAFLNSSGDGVERKRLLEGEFWKRARVLSDGRRSMAMLALIEGLRQLRCPAVAPTVVAIDDTAFQRHGADRDLAMANSVLATLHDHAEARMLLLAGNYHARQVKPRSVLVDGRPYDPPVPMAARMNAVAPISVEISARSGEFWACQKTCGPQRLPAATDGGDAIVVSELDAASDGYHMRVVLPKFTASPPVVAE